MAVLSLVLHSLKVLNAFKLGDFSNELPYIKMFHIQTSLINADRFLNSALFTSFVTIFGGPWISMFLAKL